MGDGAEVRLRKPTLFQIRPLAFQLQSTLAMEMTQAFKKRAAKSSAKFIGIDHIFPVTRFHLRTTTGQPATFAMQRRTSTGNQCVCVFTDPSMP